MLRPPPPSSPRAPKPAIPPTPFGRSPFSPPPCLASLWVARLFRLPEAYWAPITTLVIAQSSLGAALAVSWQRFVGTALGAVVGAIAASYFGAQALVFTASVFILGLLCALARSDQSAYRFGGVTLAIVMMVPRTGPAWQIAFRRFAEVSIGIGVALILSAVWPEKEGTVWEKKWVVRRSRPARDPSRRLALTGRVEFTLFS